MKKITFLIALVLCNFFGFSQTEYLDGVLVLNEGGAGSGNSTISFVSSTNVVTNNIYGLINPGMKLGDTGQSLTMYEDVAIIVLNISNEVKIVNSKTFQHIASISTGLVDPRYSAVYNNKAYVTCWGSTTDDYLAVIDLTTNTIETTITIPNGSEKIIEANGKLYIAHQDADIVSVYDIASQQLDEIQVASTPSELKVIGNDLYVLCGVQPWGTGTASLYKVDLTTDTVSSTTAVPATIKAFHMDTDGTYLYMSSLADVYRYEIATNTFDSTAFISTGITGFMGMYGMNVIDGSVYVADAKNFVSSGSAYVYSTQNGTLSQTYTVGITPNHFYKSAKKNLSTNKPTMVSVSVFPNPTSDVLNIKTEEPIKLASIYSVSGQKLVEAKADVLNVSQLKAGVYILKVQTNKGVATLKFVKK